jgi:hypothetical protein
MKRKLFQAAWRNEDVGQIQIADTMEGEAGKRAGTKNRGCAA